MYPGVFGLGFNQPWGGWAAPRWPVGMPMLAPPLGMPMLAPPVVYGAPPMMYAMAPPAATPVRAVGLPVVGAGQPLRPVASMIVTGPAVAAAAPGAVVAKRAVTMPVGAPAGVVEQGWVLVDTDAGVEAIADGWEMVGSDEEVLRLVVDEVVKEAVMEAVEGEDEEEDDAAAAAIAAALDDMSEGVEPMSKAVPKKKEKKKEEPKKEEEEEEDDAAAAAIAAALDDMSEGVEPMSKVVPKKEEPKPQDTPKKKKKNKKKSKKAVEDEDDAAAAAMAAALDDMSEGVEPMSKAVQKKKEMSAEQAEAIERSKAGRAAAAAAKRGSAAAPALAGEAFEASAEPHIVIDTGSWTTKAGFSGAKSPAAVFETLVGSPKEYVGRSALASQESSFVGDAAQKRRSMLLLRHPIEHGIVRDWDAIEQIWDYTFDTQLRADSSGRLVVLTEAAFSPNPQRVKTAELMFEVFEVGALQLCRAPVMTLYSQGLTTGLAIDSGAGSTSAVPVFEGLALDYAVEKTNLGGNDLSAYLERVLQTEGSYRASTASEKDVVRRIKESLCYCVGRGKAARESPASAQEQFELPDGAVIELARERFLAPEVLVDPKLAGLDCDSLPGVVKASLDKIANAELRDTMLAKIFLGGGNGMVGRLADRLLEELVAMAKPKDKQRIGRARITAVPHGDLAAWRGASVLASLDSTLRSCVTKAEYDEFGPDAVLRKCF